MLARTQFRKRSILLGSCKDSILIRTGEDRLEAGRGPTRLRARVRNRDRLENRSHVVPKTEFQDGGGRTRRSPHFSINPTPGSWWASLIGQSPSVDSQCPGCLGQAVVTLRLPSAIVESLWRHKRVPFVNIASVRSRSIKRRQWRHKMDYYGVVFAHLATGRGINAKDPSELDSDRWIPHSRCCENPARAKALAGFSRHLSAGFTDLNPAPRGLSLYIATSHWLHPQVSHYSAVYSQNHHFGLVYDMIYQFLGMEAKNYKFGMFCQQCHQSVASVDADIRPRNASRIHTCHLFTS